MAYEAAQVRDSVEAGADLSSDQFKLVTIAADGQVDVTTNSATALPYGVLQNKPGAAGEEASVVIYGVTKAIAGETIAAGEPVGPSTVTAGRVDDADTTGDNIIGIAKTGGDAGEVITILFIGGAVGIAD